MTTSKEEPKLEDFHALLDYASRNVYRAKDADTRSDAILNSCLKLLGKDYKYTVINNANGELCSHYPTKIPILEYIVSEKESNSANGVQSMYDIVQLKELFNKARFARCRARFAVPVILCEGKHICRGATLSGGAEIYGRSSFDFFFTGGESIPEGARQDEAAGSSEWHLFNRFRGQDIRLLKTFSVGHICDLMVEKKKVKFGMNVTSSEKVDKENRYSDFGIWSMPYPGCEFFKEWRDNNYVAEGMMFDWNQAYCDAILDLTGQLMPPPGIDWITYRKWDLVKLTQNYLRLFLHYIKEGNSGLLIHCISGWDRTPLFISLVRLSLWADGLAHPGLTAREILYLTIGYDWFLFGHNFPDRLAKGEEIFFFCFNFLKYIASEEFSVIKRPSLPDVGITLPLLEDMCSTRGHLLSEPDIQRASYRGSNTSISSISSAASTKSSVDNAPIYFTAGSPEEDAFVLNGHPSQHSPATTQQQQHLASNRNTVDPSHHRVLDAGVRGGGSASSVGVTGGCTTTMPVSVPSHVRRMPEMRQSPSYGSWQIISGSGSLRGSASSHESPRSSTSEQSPMPHTGRDCPESEEASIPIRRQKLETVRNIFLSVYNTSVGFPNVAELGGGGGGISGLLGNFAEKVGFKQSRGSVV